MRGATFYRLVSASLLGPSIAWFARGEGLIESPSFAFFREGQGTSEGHLELARRREVIDLYDRLRPSLYQYLVCLGLTPQDADDVIQEAFLRLVRFRKGGGAVENPRSWVFRVAHNLSRDVHRTERHLLLEGDRHTTKSPLERRDPSLNPEELFLHNERLLRLGAAMSQLTERQRQFLHLRAEGLRYHEIAEVLSTTVSNVNETLRRAIVRVMEKLYD